MVGTIGPSGRSRGRRAVRPPRHPADRRRRTVRRPALAAPFRGRPAPAAAAARRSPVLRRSRLPHRLSRSALQPPPATQARPQPNPPTPSPRCRARRRRARPRLLPLPLHPSPRCRRPSAVERGRLRASTACAPTTRSPARVSSRPRQGRRVRSCLGPCGPARRTIGRGSTTARSARHARRGDPAWRAQRAGLGPRRLHPGSRRARRSPADPTEPLVDGGARGTLVCVGARASRADRRVRRLRPSRRVPRDPDPRPGADALPDRRPRDPRRRGLAVRERARATSGHVAGFGVPSDIVRPLSPAAGERRAHGQRHGRARHSGDGRGGRRGRVAA